MEKDIPDKLPIYFLGISDKFNTPAIARATDGHMICRQDIVGLRTIHISHIFPINANEFHSVFLIDAHYSENLSEKQVKIVHEDGSDVGFFNINASTFGEGNKLLTRHTIFAVKIPGTLKSPGAYSVLYGEDRIGSFMMQYIPAVPLTEERVQAIKSDPLAYKHVSMGLACTNCNSSMEIGAGIDKKDQINETIWYQDLPDTFECSCGNVKLPLKYLRESLHAMLGYKHTSFNDNVNAERNYSFSALEDAYRGFQGLIDAPETKEEELQKYIEGNQIILSIFNPKLLKFKASATTKHVTDFALLNHRDELVLIEIERANLILFKKDGGQHSELTQSFNQVENWLLEATKDRYGFINNLNMRGISIDRVTSIKGVVIAGRTKNEETQHLEKLYNRKEYQFYTYDDILKHLRHTIDQIKSL